MGLIEEVSEVAKSDKLMKLTVDFGDHKRSILAGIKQERENPKEIEGKQALFVVNLPERKMAGEVSQGMLFDIGYEDKLQPCLAYVQKQKCLMALEQGNAHNKAFKSDSQRLVVSLRSSIAKRRSHLNAALCFKASNGVKVWI